MKIIKILIVFFVLSIIFIIFLRSSNKLHLFDKDKIKNIPEKNIDDPISARGIDEFSVDTINSDNGLISNNILNILFENENILCLADKGLIRINNKTGRINFVFVDNNARFSYGKSADKGLIFIDKTGLYKFNNNKLSLLCHEQNIIPEIISFDKKVYFLTERGHLYNFNTETTNVTLIHNFSNMNFTHAFHDNNNILIASINTLYSLDPKTFSLTNIINTPENINFLLAEDDQYYLGSKNLYRFDNNTRMLSKVTGLSNNDFITFLFKEGNDIYIGKNKGISLIHLPEEGKQTDLSREEILENFAVKDSYINHIIRSDNILWISTKNNGIIKYIKTTAN